jgi:dsDNA-specific endonuclease/ATPase MutS2
MSSYTSLYRIANPKYYEMEKKKINEAQKLRYKNDPVYKEKQKQYAKLQRERQKVIINAH